MRRLILIVIVLVISVYSGIETGLTQLEMSSPMMYGPLTVNRSHIVFNLAGSLWKVDRSGGEAVRLTNGPGEDSYPVFSPDGSMLAFSRQVGGQWDVHTMPASGGEAKRLTYHPSRDNSIGWSPDGKSILFLSSRTGNRLLYKMPIDGVMPEELPFWDAAAASWSPDGQRIAVTPNSGLMDWRVYRGGMQGRIWLTDVRDWSTSQITKGDQNEELPMWIGNRIYYVSDLDGIFNLQSYDLTTGRTKQHTKFEKYGIRFAGAGADTVVFVRDGRIYLHDTDKDLTRMVNVTVKPDDQELKPRTVKAERTTDWIALDSTGDKVVLGARGDVFVLEPTTGESKNITNTNGVAERNPMISPDGAKVAYFSDELGEYQLHIRSLAEEGQTRKISIEPKPSFYRELYWSPDSSKIAFTDHRLALWVADLSKGSVTRIDQSTYSWQEEWWPRWSPDSRWLTYSKHLGNRVRTVFIYDVRSGKARQVTDGITHTEQPGFDSNGKYLYFLSSPNAGTSEFGWGVLNGILSRPMVHRRLHAMILQADGKSPILPDGGSDPEARVNEKLTEVRIDFDGLDRRVVDLPLPERDYSLVVPGRPGNLIIQINEWPVSPSPLGRSSRALYSLDISKRANLEKLVEGVDGIEVSADGGKLLFGKVPFWYLVPTSAEPKPNEGRLDLSKLTVEIDPRSEWKQIYRESWRIMRDWFYDKNHHGLDLAELEAHYAEYLPGLTRRADLNGLINRMLGHVSVSHLGAGGGDSPSSSGPPIRMGLLGADYEIANGHYRFKKIFRSAIFSDVTGSVDAPLDRPGIKVNEGEFLLAVDGQKVDASRNIFSYFEGKGSGSIKITVGPSIDEKNARTLTVYPVRSESDLRSGAMIEAYRRRVEQASNGRLGYIFIGDFGSSILHFVRLLAGYGDRKGLIIDQRYNGGGITSDYLIEWLKREPLYYYAFREGDDIAVPVNPAPPVKVLITNEQNFSAAETFAFMFKLGKVGPIVGKRTGGGGIGPYVYTPRFVDGGRVQLPNRAAYQPDGTSWGIENMGISPHFDVDVKPQDVVAGRDPQLEKAIEVALQEMKRKPAVSPRKPKYPIHR